MWISGSTDPSSIITEEDLEDENGEFAFSIDIYKCKKISKFITLIFFNTKDNKQEYVLYCDDYRTIRSMGKVRDINTKKEALDIRGAYLHFDPDKCVYSDEIYNSSFLGKDRN